MTTAQQGQARRVRERIYPVALMMIIASAIAGLHELIWYLPYSRIEGAIAIGGLIGALIWLQTENNAKSSTAAASVQQEGALV